MGRKGSREIVKAIFQALQGGEKSVGQIVEHADADWNAISNYLQTLEEAGVVSCRKDGRKKIYSLEVSPKGDTDSEHYFGLPLDPEKENTINFIFETARTYWQEATGSTPGKTQMQKTLARVNDELGLDLPIGWYLYGEMCVKQFDPAQQYSFEEPSNRDELDRTIRDTVETYSQTGSVHDLVLQRYEEANNELYLLKEEIKHKHLIPEAADRSEEVVSRLYHFIYSLPEIDDDEALSYINEFLSLASNLFQRKDADQIRRVDAELTETFAAVWRLIALYNYKHDMTEHYSESELELRIRPDIVSQKEEVKERLSALSDFVPAAEGPSTGGRGEALRGSATELSDEEKERRRKETEEDVFQK